MYRPRISSVTDVSPRRSDSNLVRHRRPVLVQESKPNQRVIIQRSILTHTNRLKCTIGPFQWMDVNGQHFLEFDLTRHTQTHRIRLVWKHLKRCPTPFGANIQDVPCENAADKRAIEIEADNFKDVLNAFTLNVIATRLSSSS